MFDSGVCSARTLVVRYITSHRNATGASYNRVKSPFYTAYCQYTRNHLGAFSNCTFRTPTFWQIEGLLWSNFFIFPPIFFLGPNWMESTQLAFYLSTTPPPHHHLHHRCLKAFHTQWCVLGVFLVFTPPPPTADKALVFLLVNLSSRLQARCVCLWWRSRTAIKYTWPTWSDLLQTCAMQRSIPRSGENLFCSVKRSLENLTPEKQGDNSWGRNHMADGLNIRSDWDVDYYCGRKTWHEFAPISANWKIGWRIWYWSWELGIHF